MAEGNVTVKTLKVFSDSKYDVENKSITPMRHRELCELKIEELLKENEKLRFDFINGKCSFDYFKISTVKITGEINGIAYALGYTIESKMGREE